MHKSVETWAHDVSAYDLVFIHEKVQYYAVLAGGMIEDVVSVQIYDPSGYLS